MDTIWIKCERMMRAHAVAWMALACLLMASRVAAANPRKAITQLHHQSWGNSHGIEYVNAIAQTSDGYLWVAAMNGLFRFDGATFTPWEPNPGEPGLPGIPFHLLATQKDALWVGGVGTMTLIQGGHSRVFILRNPEERAHVDSLIEGKDGVVWAGTTLGLYHFDGAEWQAPRPENGLPAGRVTAVASDSEGTLWVATDDGQQNPQSAIAFRRRGESKFQITTQRSEPTIMFAPGPGGKMWVAQTTRSVRAFRLDQQDIQYLAPEIRVGSQALQLDRDGGLWIATLGEGVRRIREPARLEGLDPGEVNDRLDKFTQKDGLSGDYVTCVFEDREGVIWVGTAAGLDSFCDTKLTPLSVREGLPFVQNLAVAATPEGSIWAGSTPHGFMQINPEGNRFLARDWFGVIAQGSISLIVYCLYVDAAGKLIIGTGLGVAVVDPRDGHGELVREAPDMKTVLAITRDAAGGLWLCDRYAGVCRIAGGQVQSFPEMHREADGWVRVAHTDTQGRVWLGLTTGEVALYEAGAFRLFASKDGLFNGQITMILSDGQGQVWVAGKGGISRFRDGRFQTLNRQNGLPFDDVYAGILDDAGSFWLAGESGIYRVAGRELENGLSGASGRLQGELFGLNDGLRGVVRNTPYGFRGFGCSVATKSRDGKLWFATSAGLAVADPQHIPRNPLPPPVHIERVIADGASYRAAKRLQFPARIRNCEIDYAGLSFSHSEKVRYRYKLEGYDSAWIEAGTRRQAFYSNLRPKNYQFLVSACNADGVWNETGDILEFAIPPAFYETIWFQLGCGLAVISALIGAYTWRIRQMKSRQEALQKAGELLQSANTSLQREVAERKLAQEALHAAKARFEGILEIAEDAIITVDSTQRIVLFNQGAQAVFGYSEAEAIGKKLDILLPPRLAHTHRSHLENFAKSGEISRLMAQRREIFGRRKDGGEFPAEASISKLDLGNGIVFTVILRDITERKRLENQLRRSESNLAEGQRLTKTGSWVLDFNTGKTDWSVETCRIFGFSDPPPSPPYHEFRERVRPEDREAVDRGLRECFETGEPRPLKYIFILPDGTRKNIETISQPVRDGAGKIVRLMGTVMDVTERVKAAEALRASEHLARGQLAALTRTLDSLAQEPDPDKLPKHVVAALLNQMNAHSAAIWERHEEALDLWGVVEGGRFLEPPDARAAMPSLALADPAPPLWREGLQAGTHLVLEDVDRTPCRIVLGDGRSAIWPAADLTPQYAKQREQCAAQGIRCVLISPMWMAGQLAGLISIRFTEPRAFENEEIELTKALAHQAMLAIQLMRLSRQSREAAVVAERNRMARDIHDTLAQGFTGVIMQLEAAKGAAGQGDLREAETRIERASELARSSLGEARRSVRALRPRSLRNGRLFATLDNMFKRMTEGTELNAEFHAEGDEKTIPVEYEDGLLRITQESLTNAVKHANARNFKATLTARANGIQLQLVDDGRGFDPLAEHEGFGLIGMRERVEQMHGEFLVRAKPGVGTEILVVLNNHSPVKVENGNE